MWLEGLLTAEVDENDFLKIFFDELTYLMLVPVVLLCLTDCYELYTGYFNKIAEDQSAKTKDEETQTPETKSPEIQEIDSGDESEQRGELTNARTVNQNEKDPGDQASD